MAATAQLFVRPRPFQSAAAFPCFCYPSSQQTTSKILRQRRFKSSVLSKPASETEATRLRDLLGRLRKVDTSALCDVDKAKLAAKRNGDATEEYVGLGLMETSMRPRNYRPHALKVGGMGSGNPSSTSELGGHMAGVARTVQCTRQNDFFALIRGLECSKPGDVLVVNTLDSTRAVAGGLFLSEAYRRRMSGIVVDGPIRDVAQLAEVEDLLAYSTSVTPYSGTVQSIGEVNIPVTCGGVRVCPGDLVVGDGDGVLVGSQKTFETVIELAENIMEIERQMLQGLREGKPLHSMMNYKEHLDARAKGEDSALQFKKTRLHSFHGVKPVEVE